MEGVAEHLLGPVQDGSRVAHQGLPPAQLLVELESEGGGEVGTVVHGALHVELGLKAPAVQVAGHQRLQAGPVSWRHPQEGAALRSEAPLVKVPRVEVRSELLQLEVQLAGSVSPVNEDENAELLQPPSYFRHREDEG